LVFDPCDPEFLADPYAEFTRLRERGEVHTHEGFGLAIAVLTFWASLSSTRWGHERRTLA
jgi:hypothetical protein